MRTTYVLFAVVLAVVCLSLGTAAFAVSAGNSGKVKVDVNAGLQCFLLEYTTGALQFGSCVIFVEYNECKWVPETQSCTCYAENVIGTIGDCAGVPLYGPLWTPI